MGRLLTTADVAQLFSRENRAIKRWLLYSNFPEPRRLREVFDSDGRLCRNSRMWDLDDIEKWLGRRPITRASIMTTPDVAAWLSTPQRQVSVRDVKRGVADKSLCPPAQTIVMRSGRQIRIWFKPDVYRWFGIRMEDYDVRTVSGVGYGIGNIDNPDVVQLVWNYELPDGRAGHVLAPTRSEARAAIKEEVGYSRRSRLPIGTRIWRRHVE